MKKNLNEVAILLGSVVLLGILFVVGCIVYASNSIDSDDYDHWNNENNI